MVEYSMLGKEVSGIKNYVLLNMFGLVCTDLNTEMFSRYTGCPNKHGDFVWNYFFSISVNTVIN